MTRTPEPTVMAVEYVVSCLPIDHPDASIFTVRVEYRGDGRWAVKWNGAYFDADGNRSWGFDWRGGQEPHGDAEFADYEKAQEAWLARFRFDHDTALEVARKFAPQLKVGPHRSYGVADALARLAEDDGSLLP